MKTISPTWIGGALLGLGGLAIFLYLDSDTRQAVSQSGPAVSAQTQTADPTQSSGSADQIAALQAQIDKLRTQTAAQRLHGDAAPADQKRAIEEDSRRHAAFVAGLQAAFGRERVDPRWAPTATTRLRDAINHDATMRGAMRNVECRATTCRVQVSDDGRGSVNKNLPLWSQQLSDLLPRMVGQSVVGANGQTETVLYLMAPDAAATRGPRG
ncbi:MULTISPECIES: hypothetical protein [unclassified Lysobacter]|uniref:hypothetical protein n=1 Tax=unclassified Lysobacter TaxID=2635362 RepID=UPI001BEBA91A|nr:MULTISPECIES: hypothetical protein [unclassified Lysobacter]MBT2746618.1 hypothetical protein [Lysobacter sp. ISL-42]MBT2753387.1 hypothetical protein [Lysobacter sp. ISL-50]MBT2775497.1 hypothetical protein [Lysobacter sp. ISL-54]MBT2782967.1 hypothetical protein [Lysobacter sp. ISL-52]